VAAVAIVLMGIGAFLLSQVSADGTYFGDLFPGLLVFGLGLGGGPVAAISAALSCPATTGRTRSGRTCWRWPVITRPPYSPTGGPHA
jgi:hypothetical protein